MTVKRGDKSVLLLKIGLQNSPSRRCDWTLPNFDKSITSTQNKDLEIRAMGDQDSGFDTCKIPNQNDYANCTFTDARPISWLFTPIGFPPTSTSCGITISEVIDSDSGIWKYDYGTKEEYQVTVQGIKLQQSLDLAESI